MRMGRCLLRTRQCLLYIWSVPKKLPRRVCRPGNRFGSDEQNLEGERAPQPGDRTGDLDAI